MRILVSMINNLTISVMRTSFRPLVPDSNSFDR